MIVNPALDAEKHDSHDKRVSTVLASNGTHACATDPLLLACFLREALLQRETT